MKQSMRPKLTTSAFRIEIDRKGRQKYARMMLVVWGWGSGRPRRSYIDGRLKKLWHVRMRQAAGKEIEQT